MQTIDDHNPMAPLRIHYPIVWNDLTSAGVLRKVQETVETWTKLGAAVRTSIISRDPRAHDWALALSNASSCAAADAWSYSSPWTLDAAMRACLGDAGDHGADVVYSRFDLFLPALHHSRRRRPIALEVNSHLHRELGRERSFNSWYRRATFRMTTSIASGIVFVSDELSASPHFSHYLGHRTVIANGIDLSSYEREPRPPAATGSPRAVFIGTSNQAWHGIDKIVWLANRLPTWHFDIIGEEAPTIAPPGNVRFHGFMKRHVYEGILARADVAFGTLALHRKGMYEASPLKVREYLANGIPTIIGYTDTDFAPGSKVLLTLPNDETNVRDNVDRIERFVDQWRGRRVPRSAVAHIDLHAKEARRLAFLRQLVDERKHPRA